MDRKSFRKRLTKMNMNSIVTIMVSLFGIVACICCDEGCCEKREKWSDNATNAMSMVTNWLQCAADCVGKPLCWDEKWQLASRQCEKLDTRILAITDMRERLRLAAWIERTVYKAMESQTNNVATLEFCFSARRTIDSVVNAIWTSTGDTNLVLGIWERLHRKGRIVASYCEEDRKKVEPDYRRLSSNCQYFAYKLTKVSMRELTPREREMFKEKQEKWWPTKERYRYLDDLVKSYAGNGVLIYHKGAILGNSYDIAVRFTQLSPEERDRLAAYTIEEYIARHMR